jgi:molybdopterin molybdotransferase
VLGADLPANDQRQDYLRARLTSGADGRQVATAVLQQDSSLLAKLSEAGALILRPPHSPPATAGSLCDILKFPL